MSLDSASEMGTKLTGEEELISGPCGSCGTSLALRSASPSPIAGEGAQNREINPP